MAAGNLQVINGFLAKADGKDKLTALIQYACMFISGGEPGNVKKIQASVTAARKVFRVLRPLECITPVLLKPGLGNSPTPALEALNKAKAVLMAIYFAADHYVWAYQIGLTKDKQLGERFQKLSLYSWAFGSLCQVAAEGMQVQALLAQAKEAAAKSDGGELDEEEAARQQALQRALNTRALSLVHGIVQAALAAGLLGLTSWKPRTVGLLGVTASAINCYMLLPPLPKPAPAGKVPKKDV